MKTKILVIDDDPKICRLIKRILIKEDMLVECIASGIVTLPLLKKSSFDVILLDFRLPDMDGFKLLEKIQENRLLKATEVILMTGYGDTEMGMKAMEKGCVDYLPKPFNHEDLVFQIKRAVKKIQFQHKIHKLTESDIIGFEDIIGSSPDMKQIYRLVNRIAGQDTTVLLEGETGTGKNLIARAIYKKSKIKDRLFIPVNCGALTETLMESELFGHEKGAFTGADVKKYGILESAHEGTVFLDEINNASRNVQTKLLQYIETGEIMRVGGNKMIECNSRIIAA
ncbi:MAG: sigma-54 dependent transcriptional regulator, partial [Spirochaetes bacterium]|nr:sigma-54 dependent transcriptional regulator [Spirochaetota bacterium]